MSLNERIKKALAEESMIKVYGPHSKYNTWRGKYYRALQLLSDVEDMLDPDYPSFTIEDMQKAHKAGKDINTKLSSVQNFKIFLQKEYDFISVEDYYNELNSW